MRVDVIRSVDELFKLAQRYDKGQGFRRYVKERVALVAPLALLMLATGIVFASALIVFAGPHIWLALPAMILAPFVLVGSLLVQAFLYFSWLENRAMAKALGHPLGAAGPVSAWIRRHLRAEMGRAPPVPWDLAALFLAAPFLVLLSVSSQIALALALVHVAAPFFYARLEASLARG